MRRNSEELIGRLKKNYDGFVIEVTNAEKGGGGKTSETYNRASALAMGGLRVLVIDGDNSCNLTNSYRVGAEKTIFDVFVSGEVPIISTGKENIDIIPGSPKLTDNDTKLEEYNNKYMIFFMWIVSNYDYLGEHYDYILIDTHNDASLITKNFIAASKIVTAVINADMHGFTAWLKLEETLEDVRSKAIDPLTRKSYVDTTPFLIGNRVKTIAGHFTRTGNDFIEVASESEGYLGLIPEKELFARSLSQNKSVFEQFDEMDAREQKRHLPFIENLLSLYQTLNEKINIEKLGE